jgi:hypothetical protein
MVHDVGLAGLHACGGLLGAALLAARAGVVAELRARLEVLYAYMWMMGPDPPSASRAAE